MLQTCAVSCAVCTPGGLKLVLPPGRRVGGRDAEEWRQVVKECSFVIEEEAEEEEEEGGSLNGDTTHAKTQSEKGEGDGSSIGIGGEAHVRQAVGGESCDDDDDDDRDAAAAAADVQDAQGARAKGCRHRHRHRRRRRRQLLPAAPPPGSFVARGPDPALLPFVLVSPLTALRDEVYTVYVRLTGQHHRR